MLRVYPAMATLAKDNVLRKELDAMVVYVTNQHGQPLMPCSSSKARLLWKSGKAQVVPHTL